MTALTVARVRDCRLDNFSSMSGKTFAAEALAINEPVLTSAGELDNYGRPARGIMMVVGLSSIPQSYQVCGDSSPVN
ncbi:hypothetical protein CBOM_00835 [Ceraceosorus bombacis]|uniref:Uncharacterized protein n=1 Tax=Ceraceosorus bombacis TaxID=401625 RepID=A0A0P1BC58_9BASI|nr:hypothetical protein CBOM_00835 [Ceraceosorus bombacis]